jgi:hypothetical protein
LYWNTQRKEQAIKHYERASVNRILSWFRGVIPMAIVDNSDQGKPGTSFKPCACLKWRRSCAAMIR